MRKRKSQYSMEFLIFFATLSILFFAWLVIYSDVSEEVFRERNEKAVTDLGKSIQTQFFVTANARHGFSSSNLIIPEAIINKQFDINNSNYVMFIDFEGQDYVFHIPYSIGYLNKTKGQNILYNVHGVVCINDPDCVEINYTDCEDGVDNDEDQLQDEEDGGCYYNYTLPFFLATLDEPPPDHVLANNITEVYNYYVVCKNAEAFGLCDNITVFFPDTPFAGNTGIRSATILTPALCQNLTAGAYCS